MQKLRQEFFTVLKQQKDSLHTFVEFVHRHVSSKIFDDLFIFISNIKYIMMRYCLNYFIADNTGCKSIVNNHWRCVLSINNSSKCIIYCFFLCVCVGWETSIHFADSGMSTKEYCELGEHLLEYLSTFFFHFISASIIVREWNERSVERLNRSWLRLFTIEAKLSEHSSNTDKENSTNEKQLQRSTLTSLSLVHVSQHSWNWDSIQKSVSQFLTEKKSFLLGRF